MDFAKVFVHSAKQLKHPLLFVPDFFMFLLTIVLGAGFFKFSGMNSIVSQLMLTESSQMELFRGLIADKWVALCIGVVIFFISTFLIGVGTDILRFNMITELAGGSRRLKLSRAWRAGKGMFRDVVVLKVWVYLLSLLVFGLILAAGVSVYLVTGAVSSVLSVVMFIVGAVLLVWLRLGLLFRYPVLFVEKRKPWKTVLLSFAFMKGSFWSVALTAVVLITTLIVFSVAVLPITYSLDWLQRFATVGVLGLLLGYFLRLLKAMINLVYTLFSHLFVFNCYLESKKKRF